MFGKPFLLLAAISTIGGGMAGALPGIFSPPYEDSVVFVPPARIGDRAWYSGSGSVSTSGGSFGAESGPLSALLPLVTRALDDLPGLPLHAVSAAAPPATASRPVGVPVLDFSIGPVQDWPDRTGQSRRSVAVYLAMDGNRTVTHLDLDNAYPIGMEMPLESTEGRQRALVFGPLSEGREARGSGFPFFERHDRSYRLGDRLPTEGFEDLVEALPLEISYDAWVAQRARVGGHDSYALRSRVTITPDASLRSAEEVRVVMTFDEWVSADLPYPVLVTIDLEMSVGRTSASSHTWQRLSKYEPGTAPVPWARPLKTFDFPARNEVDERSPPKTPYPVAGREDRLPYDVEDAIATCRDQPPPQFAVWGLTRPLVHLVGFQFQNRTSALGARASWFLLYATPSGEAHLLLARPAAADAPAICTSEGTHRVPSHSSTDLPERPLAFGVVERVWAAVAGLDYRDAGVNFVTWGLSPDAPAQNRSYLNLLTVGFKDDSRFSLLSSRLEEGRFEALVESGDIERTEDVPPAEADREPSITPKYASIGSRAPGLLGRGALGAFLLAGLVLGVYYVPVLRVAALRFLILAGYAKLRKDELLENEIRENLLQALREDPGLSVSQLARRLEAGWGTVVYHLGVLESNGLVSSLVDGRHHRFFPVGAVNFSERGALAILQNARTKEIYELVRRSPGVGREELARMVGVTGAAVLWHLDRLGAVGLVTHRPQGRRFQYFAASSSGTRPAPASSPVAA